MNPNHNLVCSIELVQCSIGILFSLSLCCCWTPGPHFTVFHCVIVDLMVSVVKFSIVLWLLYWPGLYCEDCHCIVVGILALYSAV